VGDLLCYRIEWVYEEGYERAQKEGNGKYPHGLRSWTYIVIYIRNSSSSRAELGQVKQRPSALGYKKSTYQSNSLAIDLSVSTLVDKLANALEVRFTIGDPGLNNAKHLKSGLGKADEDTVVDLEKTKQLEDLAGFGSNLVDTLDTDNKDKLGLGWDVERAIDLGLARDTDLLALSVTVLLHVLLSALEDGSALLLVGLSVPKSTC
jgi:hypothetical protein